MKKAWIAVYLIVLSSCGGAQRGTESESLPLGQARAVEILEEAVGTREELGSTTTNVPATLANGTEVNVDVLVRALGAGYVWMTEQDRRDYGPIPERAEGSELHAVLATLSEGENIHLLILQDQDYTYIPNPQADRRQPEEVTIDYVEARLRRDTLDFAQAIVDLRGGTD
jgi:hypothetical protein